MPDLPDIREEISWYLNSAYRADMFVGRMLQVLDDHDLTDDTFVIFLSDNGIRTPLIFRWPGRIRPNTSSDSLVSTVDLMPTILKATNTQPSHDMDGNDLSDLFESPSTEVRDFAFAAINAKGKSKFEMRALIGKQYHYIYNHFANGKNQFYDGKYGGGRSLKAMEKAAETDPEIQNRLDFMYYRTKEGLYDLRQDPHALNNLVDTPAAQDTLTRMRDRMATELAGQKDLFTSAYRQYLAAKR